MTDLLNVAALELEDGDPASPYCRASGEERNPKFGYKGQHRPEVVEARKRRQAVISS